MSSQTMNSQTMNNSMMNSMMNSKMNSQTMNSPTMNNSMMNSPTMNNSKMNNSTTMNGSTVNSRTPVSSMVNKSLVDNVNGTIYHPTDFVNASGYSTQLQFTNSITNQHHQNSVLHPAIYPTVNLIQTVSNGSLQTSLHNGSLQTSSHNGSLQTSSHNGLTPNSSSPNNQTSIQNVQTNGPNSVPNCLVTTSVPHTVHTNVVQTNLANSLSSTQLHSSLENSFQSNLSNSLPNHIPRLSQLQYHDQHPVAGTVIKKERNADMIQQSLAPNPQQISLLNNCFNNNRTANLIQTNGGLGYESNQYNLENINSMNNQALYAQNRSIMSNQSDSQSNGQLQSGQLQSGQLQNGQLQSGLSNYTNSQLVDHLNNPKKQLMMNLSSNILQTNSMQNMIGNNIQLNNGLIIRSTFNNGLTAFHPINMEDQERAKQERKRLRNR